MTKKSERPDEPNALNRLLTSSVTESWGRTGRAIALVLALTFSGGFGVALVGPPVADSLHELAEAATGHQ